jgi:hypothetical protein
MHSMWDRDEDERTCDQPLARRCPVPAGLRGWVAGRLLDPAEIAAYNGRRTVTGQSGPARSNSTTPLHSRLHPCSGWLTMTRAAMRSDASASGHRGWCLHMSSSGTASPMSGAAGSGPDNPDGRDV